MEIPSGKTSLPVIRTAMRMSRKTIKQSGSEKPRVFSNFGDEGSNRRRERSDSKEKFSNLTSLHSPTGPKSSVIHSNTPSKDFPITQFLTSPETVPHFQRERNMQSVRSLNPWVLAPLEIVGNMFPQLPKKTKVAKTEVVSPSHEIKGQEASPGHTNVRQQEKKRTTVKKKTGIFHQSLVNSLIQSHTSHVNEVESLLVSDQIRGLAFKNKAKEKNRKNSHPHIKISVPSGRSEHGQSNEATSPHLINTASIHDLPVIRFTNIDSQELDSSSSSDVEKVLEKVKVIRTPKQRPVSKREDSHVTEAVPISHAALVTEYNQLTAKVMNSTISVARRRSKLNGVSGRLLKH